RQRTGEHLLGAVDQAQAGRPIALPSHGASRKLLARYSYARAVCWMGACLADALEYAHQRGLVHLDLKPSNVLVAADGLPLLLDFHLAREPIRAGGSSPVWLGGTPGYMSPEQQAALAAVRLERPVPAVDGRSDIYSLGLLLHEALAGQPPAGGDQPPARLEQCNPQVSIGLADIIHKCLAREPGARYADAADLAADLRRHLADLPLRGVANRSPAERWRKWRRRRPAALLLIGLVAGVLGMLGGLIAALVIARTTALAHQSERRGEAVAAFDLGQDHVNRHQYPEAAAAFSHGLELAKDLPDDEALVKGLTGRLRLAERGQEAQALHRLVDLLRSADAGARYPRRGLRVFEAGCRNFWARHALLTDRSGAILTDDEERVIRQDLIDFAILWSDLRVRLQRSVRSP
ncbi:MAG TPA: protein kinase, partial [Gemmataceae bacterium]|nr:protein kinase [Gemmataceae bacterium]